MRATTKHEELQQAAAGTAQPDGLAKAPPQLHAAIRRRAYELSRQRGQADGDELSDWYRAEAEIRAAFGLAEFNDFRTGKTRCR